MATLSVMDLAFLLTESDASPKHVGGVMIFKKPASAGPDFVHRAAEQYLGGNDDLQPPFNQIIKFNLFRGLHWQTAANFNIADHIHFHQLKGSDFRDSLYKLTGALHSERLGRDAPMWEFHIIEGIDPTRFALYVKIHHAYADGMTMAAWLAKSLSTTARTKAISPIWHHLKRPGASTRIAEEKSLLKSLASAAGQSTSYLRSAIGLSKLSTQLALEMANLTKNAVAVPFKANPNTPLNGQVVQGRQIATAAVPMARVNKLRHQTRSTLNHIALTCIDGALHRYLESCSADIDQPITIQMPVNLRQEGDDSLGNKIGIVLVELASKTTDPYERLREIGFTLRNVRYQVDGVPAGSIVAYTVLLGSLAMVTEALKLGDAAPPLGHTLVSNVPGPAKTLYLGGAQLEEMYPISTLTPNNHLNITLFSYDGRLQFGLVASSAMPELQRLGDYIHEAFTELEEAVGLTTQQSTKL